MKPDLIPLLNNILYKEGIVFIMLRLRGGQTRTYVEHTRLEEMSGSPLDKVNLSLRRKKKMIKCNLALSNSISPNWPMRMSE